MGSVQRAFAQKLTKQHASDVRRQIAATSYSRDASKTGSGTSGLSSTVSLGDVVDPLDYEDFIQQHQLLIDRDPLRTMLDFPVNDIEVCTKYMGDEFRSVFRQLVTLEFD